MVYGLTVSQPAVAMPSSSSLAEGHSKRGPSLPKPFLPPVTSSLEFHPLQGVCGCPSGINAHSFPSHIYTSLQLKCAVGTWVGLVSSFLSVLSSKDLSSVRLTCPDLKWPTDPALSQMSTEPYGDIATLTPLL